MMEDRIYGKNPIIEALKNEEIILNQIYIQKDISKNVAGKIIDRAKSKGVPIKEIPKVKMDKLVEGAVHQGLVAEVSPYRYVAVEDILKEAEMKGEAPFLVILDGIEDPHNLGAIIRSAECSGVHGIIIPKRHAVQVSGTVVKASAGATAHVKIARVSNINQTISALKKENVWIYGALADEGAQPYQEQDYQGGVALVIGSEGAGIGKLTRELCDFHLSIPMKGQINSLNASVAASILIFKVLEKRMS